jgi:hypothetical protein
MVIPNKMRITTANIKLQRDAEKNMAMDAFPSSWIEIAKRLSIDSLWEATKSHHMAFPCCGNE